MTKSFEEKLAFYQDLYLNKRTQVVSEDFYPADLEQAYAIQASILSSSGKNFQHYKLGGTNIKTQKKFNVTRSYYGLVDFAESFQITQARQQIALGGTENLAAELEVIFKLLKPITPSDAVTAKNINQFISHYTIGLEFPTNYISNLTEVGVNGLVAENCAAGYLVYGDFYTFDLEDFAEALELSFVIGEEVIKGNTGNLIGGAIGAMLDFVLLMQEQNKNIAKDSLISTGGITDCVAIPFNKIISFGNDNQRQSFTIVK